MSITAEIAFRLGRPTTVLWRNPSTLQLGLDADAVVLHPASTAIADAIELLHKPHTPTQLARCVPALSPAGARRLCAHLSSAGLLTSDSPGTVASVAVLGCGTLATATADGLRRVEIPVHRLDHDGLSDAVDRDQVVIVAAPTAEPDRVDLARLRSAGRPHLVVRIEESRAVVGPFVEPGLSACVHCDDLARAHRDRAWAGLLLQLSRRQVRPDPGLLAWAVATTVSQVRAWHRGYTPEARSRCLELGLDRFTQRQRRVAQHPDCDCRTTSPAKGSTRMVSNVPKQPVGFVI